MHRGFTKSLFRGVISEQQLFPFPSMSSDERENVRLIVASVQRFFQTSVDSAKIDQQEEIPSEVLDGMKQLGLFGMTVPVEYGGIGLSHTAYARVMQEIAGLDASLAVTLGAHESIGFRSILQFGSDAQKRKYLPRLASGEWIAGFALTEPSAGSDASAVNTHAELTSDGEAYILNGSKSWITNGGFGDLFTVFARTAPPGPGRKPKITAFLVERDFGIRSGASERKLGIRGASTTPLFFDDLRIPAANVVGEAGRGFKVAMEVLNLGRLSLASGCVGACKKLIRLSTDRALERTAFGRKVADFALVKDKVAKMMARTFALESMTYLTTGLVDSKAQDYAVESAICKVFGSETLWRVANESLQIAAGAGYMRDFPFERHLRDARINLIFTGTNEILRRFVALGAMQDHGRDLTDISSALRTPVETLGRLGDFALQRARTVLGRTRFRSLPDSLMPFTSIFEHYSTSLARTVASDARSHGKAFVELEIHQKRFADIAIDLYGLAACISRCESSIQRFGEEGARKQLDLCALFAREAEGRLQACFRGFEDNDDPLRQQVAETAYRDSGYLFDIL